MPNLTSDILNVDFQKKEKPEQSSARSGSDICHLALTNMFCVMIDVLVSAQKMRRNLIYGVKGNESKTHISNSYCIGSRY